MKVPANSVGTWFQPTSDARRLRQLEPPSDERATHVHSKKLPGSRRRSKKVTLTFPPGSTTTPGKTWSNAPPSSFTRTFCVHVAPSSVEVATRMSAWEPSQVW